jgi:CHAT domain-containing protein
MNRPTTHLSTASLEGPMYLRKKLAPASPCHQHNADLKFLALPIILVLALLLSPGYPRTLSQSQAGQRETLSPDLSHERALMGGQAHTYQLTVGAQQYFRVIVEQRGVDVVVALSTADGKQLYEVDSPNGTAGTEEIPFVTQEAGRYLISVRCLDQQAPSGRYLIRVAELRQATTSDESRSTGERALAEAGRLRRQNKAEATRQAIARYEAAARAFKTVGETRPEIDALYAAAEAFYELGELPKVQQLTEQVLQLAQQTGYRDAESKALSALAAVYAARSESRKALEYQQAALIIVRELKDIGAEVSILSNLGAIHSQLAEYPQALAAYQQALAVSQNTDKSKLDAAVSSVLRESEGALLANLCAFHSRLGQMQQALAACRQALPILRELKLVSLEGRTLSSLALTLKRLGQPEQALEYNLEAVRVLNQAGARRDEAIALNDLGLIYFDLGDFAKAIATYEQSLKLAQEVKNQIGEGNTRHNLGVAYALAGEPAKAQTAFEQSLELTRATGNREGEVSVLIALGRLQFKLGNPAKAAAFFSQALLLGREIQLAPQTAAALFYLAESQRTLGNLSEALNQGAEALRLTESLRAQIGDARLRTSFFASVQDRYEAHLAAQMQAHAQHPDANHAAAALHTFERARGRGLLELLAEAQTDLRQGVDAALLAREQLLQQQLNTKAAAQTRLLAGKHTAAAAAASAKELATLTAQAEEVKEQIRLASPRYAALTQPQPLNTTDIQRLLDPDTLLLEYALGEQASYLWAVTPTTLTSYQLPPRAEVEAAARQVYASLTARQPLPGLTEVQQRARVRAAEDAFPAQALTLSRMLLGPVAGQLNKQRLAIVAAGALAYLPFAALPDPAEPTQSLLAAHEIVTLPSASVLAVIRREAAQTRATATRVAVFADPVFEANDPRVLLARKGAPARPLSHQANPQSSKGEQLAELGRALRAFTAPTGNAAAQRNGLTRLPFSREEAEAIAVLVPGSQVLQATGFAASRGAILNGDLSRYRYLHFATHGLLNAQHPELSGLVFSLVNEAGQPQDGFLRLHEIYNLRLSAEVVVLSACQTALGKEVRGEGLIGLTRGFMHAGAPRVVASLWQVDDLATAELMKRFYTGMLKGNLRPAAALRAAQLELMKQKPRAAPFYWAAFVLQGEWR